MNTITFEEAQGKWLDYTSSKVRCDKPEYLRDWLKYVVKDGRIYFDERLNTFRVDSEEQRRAEQNYAICMQNFIRTGGKLD